MIENYRIIPRRKNLFGNLKANTILVIINVAVFVLLRIFPSLLNYFALSPLNILQGKLIWTLLTSMFSHAAFVHLAFNMISLFFVGVLVEKILGPKRYVLFYLASGLFAGIVFVLLSGFFGNAGIGERIFGNPSILAVGASGAIFGLVGMLAVLIPKRRIYLIAGPLIAIIIQIILQTFLPGMPLSEVFYFLINIYIFASIFLMFSFNSNIKKIILPLKMPFWLLPIIAIVPLIIVSLFMPLPIGNSAHFGGLLIGLIYGLYLKQKFPKKTQMISKVLSN
ncbi:MAG: rhomboid family intramembrane serine protease [Candidatus Nanoarchaeia archaeon]|nr:rhomboid family intramembrane serine protease [Candidatus Nanoarchaeia archaeon]